MDYLIYKKGLDEREIFSEEEDFRLWEKLMAEYLQPYVEKDTIYKGLRPYIKRKKIAMNLFGKVELLAYCLMPTYIYMLVREKEKGSTTALMRRVTTYYSMLYNKKRKRSGYVFAGSYKSKTIKDEVTLQKTIKLVHEIPGVKTVRKFGVVQTTTGVNAAEYPFSSFADYRSDSPRDWITVVPLRAEVMDITEDKLPW